MVVLNVLLNSERKMNQIVTVRQASNGLVMFLFGLTLTMLGFYAGRNTFNHGHWYVTVLICVVIVVELFVIKKSRGFRNQMSDSVRVLTKSRFPVAFGPNDPITHEPGVLLSEVTVIVMYSKNGQRVLTFQAGNNTFTLPAFKKAKSDWSTYFEQEFFSDFIDACTVPDTLFEEQPHDGFTLLGKKEAKQYLKINALDVIRPKD
jgi:hypothetical protein